MAFLHIEKDALTLAANRDEFYNRPTAVADWWPPDFKILGGRDLESQHPDGTSGSWLGITLSGRLALLTNYRDPAHINADAPSRGFLVSEFLSSHLSPPQYLEHVAKVAHQYNGFNLIVGVGTDLYYFSNYQNQIRHLNVGFYGLSNHLLDTPWPKVTRGKQKLQHLMKAANHAQLLDILYDNTLADDSTLPDTGVGIERERMLSPMFIKSSNYGTRCSTIISLSSNGKVAFTERTYTPNSFHFEDRPFDFITSTHKR